MSNITATPSVAAFFAAQDTLADSVGSFQEAFAASAVACFRALSDVSGKALADANKARLGSVSSRMVSGFVYTSNASIGYHGMTGEILAKPNAEDDEYSEHVYASGDEDGYDKGVDAEVVPTEVQKLIARSTSAKTGIGTDAVRKIIAASETQQDAIFGILDAMAALKDADDDKPASGAGGGSDESGEDGEGATLSTEDSTVETLLARALAMLGEAPASDSVRELVGQLVAKVGPVAVPVDVPAAA